ncbi:hypothetical protein V498_08252 [Pseudogymnoascus sp. VKM F-4517 (FW-2822)]|nr:hypothetical protein V498_08252 [Pseudogymnoascus sp. VKM F-4517 (FW-2822)]
MGTASRGTTHLSITGGCDGTLQSTYYADHLEAWNTATPLPFKLDRRAQGFSTFKDAAVPQNTNLGISPGEDSVDTGGPYAMKSGALLLLLTLALPTSTAQLSFARPSTLAMADEASNQRRKRYHADESADQLASSRCQEVRTRNRWERDQGMSPKLAEVVETLVEALNKRKRQRLNKVSLRRGLSDMDHDGEVRLKL